jgi:hypothetical protein
MNTTLLSIPEMQNRVLYKKEFIEVEIIKMPKSKLNDYVRQIGKVVQVMKDGIVVKLESRKLVKFPQGHFREIRRYSKTVRFTEEPQSYEPVVNSEDVDDEDSEGECDYGDEENENCENEYE